MRTGSILKLMRNIDTNICDAFYQEKEEVPDCGHAREEKGRWTERGMQD